ncbi:hypothetical protein Cgig2_004542 [Carnegiea gigantea]|uniref:Uncharacterized protein n=1 Tax=Carnegiea gigantea TaxID=171969 RepID=A0A9Q1QDR7_9CARY|nr:hypothetical protein Cgig2_004542 [Carnegiea gigantea]
MLFPFMIIPSPCRKYISIQGFKTVASRTGNVLSTIVLTSFSQQRTHGKESKAIAASTSIPASSPVPPSPSSAPSRRTHSLSSLLQRHSLYPPSCRRYSRFLLSGHHRLHRRRHSLHRRLVVVAIITTDTPSPPSIRRQARANSLSPRTYSSPAIGAAGGPCNPVITTLRRRRQPCLRPKALHEANGGRRGSVGGDDGNDDELAMETVTMAMETMVAGEEETRVSATGHFYTHKTATTHISPSFLTTSNPQNPKMSSVCISSCVEDARLPARVRATYVNLYKWPESDAEFVRSVSFRGPGHPRSKVVESISCRQMYLRSYTFTRKESVNERTRKCIGRVKERVLVNGRSRSSSWCGSEKSHNNKEIRNKVKVNNKLKEVPCAAIKAFFRKLLFCSASVDVVHGISD